MAIRDPSWVSTSDSVYEMVAQMQMSAPASGRRLAIGERDTHSAQDLELRLYIRYVYICKYMYDYKYIHVCIYINICMIICIYVYVYIHVYICICMYIFQYGECSIHFRQRTPLTWQRSAQSRRPQDLISRVMGDFLVI